MAAADAESNECRRWELAYVLTVSDGCTRAIEAARAFSAEVVDVGDVFDGAMDRARAARAAGRDGDGARDGERGVGAAPPTVASAAADEASASASLSVDGGSTLASSRAGTVGRAAGAYDAEKLYGASHAAAARARLQRARGRTTASARPSGARPPRRPRAAGSAARARTAPMSAGPRSVPSRSSRRCWRREASASGESLPHRREREPDRPCERHLRQAKGSPVRCMRWRTCPACSTSVGFIPSYASAPTLRFLSAAQARGPEHAGPVRAQR